MCAPAAVLARGVGMGTGVKAVACSLIARIASTVSAIPLLVVRFTSTFLSRMRWLLLLAFRSGTAGPSEWFTTSASAREWLLVAGRMLRGVGGGAGS